MLYHHNEPPFNFELERQREDYYHENSEPRDVIPTSTPVNLQQAFERNEAMKTKYSMTDKRWDELMNDEQLRLTAKEVEDGWHWCMEMDCLLANSNDPQGDCFCSLNTSRNKANETQTPTNPDNAPSE